MTGRTLFIWNPIAGTKLEPPLTIIRKLFGDTDDVRVASSEYPGHGTELAREGVRDGCGLVVAVGGDGTLNEVGKGLLGTDAVLGHVPRGSGNAFARAFGIPLRQDTAYRALLDYRVRRVDVGSVNGEIFFANAGIGLDAEVCRRLSSTATRRRGLWPYVANTIAAFREHRPRPVHVDFEDGSIETSASLLNIANTSQFGNGAVIAPKAVPDDGQLDLVTVSFARAVDAAAMIPRLFARSIHRSPGYRTRRFTRLRIRRAEATPIQVDGESSEAARTLDVEVLRSAVPIAVSHRTRSRA